MMAHERMFEALKNMLYEYETKLNILWGNCVGLQEQMVKRYSN